MRAEHVYNEIRGRAYECNDYERLVRWLSEDNGLLPTEFERKYRRARRVFMRERAEIQKAERFAAASRF